MTRASRVGAVLLAAGASTRMGEAKQALRWGDHSLLEHATDTLLGTGCSPVVVVLGHEADRLRPLLATRQVQVVEPEDWQLGPGASLRAGAAAALATAPALEALMVSLCDQPRVTTAALVSLLDAFDRDRPALAASRYAGTRGVPVVLGRAVLRRLATLDPATGAKRLIDEAEPNVVSVDIPEAAADVDTPADYAGALRTAR